MKTTTPKKLQFFFAAAILVPALCASLGACKIPSGESISATPAGTINVSFGISEASPSRTAVPDFDAKVAVYVLTCTNTTAGTTSTAEVSGSTSHQFTNILPGSVTIGVSAYSSATVKDTTTLIATGSSPITLAAGEGASVAVTLAMASSGNDGGIDLDIQWPSALADSVEWNLNSVPQTTPDVALSGATRSAALSAASVSPGSYVMALTLKKGSTIVGTAIETVNVYANLISDKWIDSTGALASARRFTTVDFGVSGTDMALSIQAGTNTYFITFSTLLSETISVPFGTNSISLIPANASAGEKIQYAYGGNTVTMASGSTYTITSLSLPATIEFTVTSADGSSTQGFSLTVAGATAISTPAGLAGMSGTGNYVLTGNIDLSSYGNWTPTGSSVTPFTGTFDGGGHTISNVTVSSASGDGGLFGYISSPAVISNVRLKNMAIDCTFGDLSTDGVGGIAGENYGGTISRCSVSGAIYGKGWRIGGIVGNNRSGGIVSECYSTATVTTTGSFAGGLVGWNWGTIENCYSRGSVSGNDSVGGLVAYNLSNTPVSTVVNCYSASLVSYASSGSFIGGLIASNWGTCANDYYDSEASGCGVCGDGTARTSAQMKTEATYAGWDFGSIWAINSAKNGGYPYLKALPVADQIVRSSSTTASALHSLLSDNLDGDFILTGPVDLGGSAWTPVGTATTPFAGTFDGGGNALTIATLNVPAKDAGVFSFIGTAGVVKNLHVDIAATTSTTANAVSNWEIGAIAGYNRGTIYRCSSSGSITGYNSIGGLVGENHGKIEECWSNAAVNAYAQSGGLVGVNGTNDDSGPGIIKNCYARGSVTLYEGGSLVGNNNNFGTIINSYAAGSVQAGTGGHDQIHVFLGDCTVTPGALTNCYFDSSKINPADDTNGTVWGTSRTTAQMKDSAHFSANYSGWDTAVWAFTAGKNNGYPCLIHNEATTDISVSSQVTLTISDRTSTGTMDCPAT